jgi:16S rRNA processing protein RimM
MRHDSIHVSFYKYFFQTNRFHLKNTQGHKVVNESKLICVGALAGAFGVRGEVRLKSFTSNPDDIENYAPLFTENGDKSFEIVITGRLKNGFAARLSGVVKKEQADDLKGTKLFVPRDRLPSLQEDEFYYSDLIGMIVYDTGGNEIGKVQAVLNHGAGDLLEIHGANLKVSVIIPFTKEAVPTVDIVSRRIVTDPPDGLLPGG